MDLHHALLGRSLGGGIAYLTGLCNPAYSVGLSSGIQGDFRSLDGAVVWDATVFMHEVGHGFGAEHTFAYEPPVDECIVENNKGEPICTSPNIPAGSGTLMSYCYLCGSGMSNLAYTFGGHRVDADTWEDNTSASVRDFNNDPWRVPKVMYDFVSSRGSCVSTSENVPDQSAASPSLGPSSSPTSFPIRGPTLIPTVQPSKPPNNSTMLPTSSPTGDHIGTPTLHPTKDPTDNSTMIPTTSPIEAPTPIPISICQQIPLVNQQCNYPHPLQ